MSIPRARVIVAKNGLPLVAQTADQVHLCIGVATSGPMMVPRLVQLDSLLSTFKGGPATKAAAYVTSRTDSPVMFVRVPSTARAARFVPDAANWTGGAVAASGTPDLYGTIVVKTITSGTVGVSGIEYQLSLDGGVTFGATVALLLATTIVTSGVTITLTAAAGFAGDWSVLCIPASETRYGAVLTKDVTSGDITLTGTPKDQYEVVFEIVNGGTAGAEGITARYSLDGGRSYSAVTRLGTALTLNLVDYTGSGYVEQSGIVANLVVADTYKAGDKIVCKTMPPEPQVSDVNLALQAIDDEQQFAGKYSFAHAVGNLGGFSDAQALHAKMAALEAEDSFSFVLTSGRDQGSAEPDASFEAEQAALVAPLDCDRVAISAGYCRITDPCGGWFMRRPVSFRIAERLIARPVNEALHNFSVGSVDDCDIFDTSGNVIEHDARLSSTLHDARYVTLRTRKHRQGVYFTGSPTMAAPVGVGQVACVVIPYRRILDIGSAVLQVYGEDQLGREVLFVDSTTGLPEETGAQIFDSGLAEAITAAVGVGGGVVPGALAVKVKLSRNTPITGSAVKLKVDVRMVPIPFVGEFEGTISFTSRVS